MRNHALPGALIRRVGSARGTLTTKRRTFDNGGVLRGPQILDMNVGV